MTTLRLLLVLLLCISPIYSEALDFSKLFEPKKKVVKKAVRKKSVQRQVAPKQTATPIPSQKYYVVDDAWMARYRVLEATWDYESLYDDQIKKVDGKYYVPPVVYRHYEDMAKTPPKVSPTPTPTPTPKPSTFQNDI